MTARARRRALLLTCGVTAAAGACKARFEVGLPPCDPPVGVTAVPRIGEVDVAWLPLANLTGYRVSVFAPGETEPAREIDVGSTVTAVTVTALTPAIGWRFVVAGIDRGDPGAGSFEIVSAPLGDGWDGRALAAAPRWSVTGSTFAGGEFGSALAFADTDADGRDELFVGAPLEEVGVYTDGGRCYQFSLVNDSALVPAAWSAAGDFAGAKNCFSLANAGDVDGDTRDDVLVGSIERSRIDLFFSDASGQLPGTSSWNHVGSGTFGWSVAGLGDVDADGRPDFAGGGISPVPELRTWLGSSAPTLDADLSGNAMLGSYGTWTIAGGDFDDDGYSDVVLGAPLDGLAGVLRFANGDGSGLGPFAVAWSPKQNDSIARRAGIAMATGDIDGDAVADLLVGAPGLAAEPGEAFAFRGGNVDFLQKSKVTLTSDVIDDFFGMGVAVGDVNGDGYDDGIVVSERRSELTVQGGRAQLFLGGPAFLSSAAAWTYDGDFAGQRMRAVAAGDVDGDGSMELAVAAPYFDDSRGRVLVFAGARNAGPALALTVPSWQGTTFDAGVRIAAGARVATCTIAWGDGDDETLDPCTADSLAALRHDYATLDQPAYVVIEVTDPHGTTSAATVVARMPAP